MNPTRTQLLALCAVGLVVLLTLGVLAGVFGSVSPATDLAPGDDRPDDPATSETIGYVEGYWYDDDLPIDDRDDATIEEAEFESVVYRSMARVEHLRELPFEDSVDVEVISREEFQAEEDDVFGTVTDEQRFQQNVNYEALLMVDRHTEIEDETDALFGDTVGGYYDLTTNEVVVVAEDPDEPETDEVILGHELLHALQDQHFDLTSYDRETIDREAGKNGLIEGDAVWIEEAYGERCGEEWACLEPTDQPQPPGEFNWGLYLILIQPYDDGPDYIESLLTADGWSAVNDAYDEPPTTSSEVIRPGEDRNFTTVEVTDRSEETWQPFEVDEEPATETVGEVGMVSMFAAGSIDGNQPAIIDRESLTGSEGGPVVDLEYDQPYTDGWAGDELAVYVPDDAETSDERLEESAFVWKSEWMSAADAEQFADAYRELLERHGGLPVEDRADTYELEGDFPGTYDIDQAGERVTIVRTPDADDIEAVYDGSWTANETT